MMNRAKVENILNQAAELADKVTPAQRRLAMYNIERMMPAMGKAPMQYERLVRIERINDKDTEVMDDVNADDLRAFVENKRAFLGCLPE